VLTITRLGSWCPLQNVAENNHNKRTLSALSVTAPFKLGLVAISRRSSEKIGVRNSQRFVTA
jgi:hypothetical protein